MTTDRYVIVGVATARAEWFRSTSQWATSSALPIEFLRCISADEARARLNSGRPHSALVIDERTAGLDRDLIKTADDNGCAVFVITAQGSGRDWLELGASDEISAEDFDRSWLLDALRRHAQPIADIAPKTAVDLVTDQTPAWTGTVIAVTGPGGTGASTAAMAIAQGIGSDPREHALVCLADLKLDAELAVLHDARDVVPGLQELIDLHRTGVPSRSQVQEGCFCIEQRNYDLLLGLRNHRDWTTLRRRSSEVALAGLTRSYRHVVLDVDPDVEGESDTGSIDVEDRNTLTHVALRTADVVVVVGDGSMKGLFALTRTVQRLTDFGVEPTSLVVVINRAPRRVGRRIELVNSFTDLLSPELEGVISSPILVPYRRSLAEIVRDVAPLPAALVKPLTTEVLARRSAEPADSTAHVADEREPELVKPGSLASLTAPATGTSPGTST